MRRAVPFIGGAIRDCFIRGVAKGDLIGEKTNQIFAE
jgi:hypothetical protein